MENKSIVVNDLEFKYNEKEQAYGKVINVENKNILVICYESYANNDMKQVLDYASNYIIKLDINKLKQIIVDNLYQPKDDWYGVDENGNTIEYSKEEYLLKLELKTILVSYDGVEYWFNDNGLYAGHDITIYNHHNKEDYKVELAG